MSQLTPAQAKALSDAVSKGPSAYPIRREAMGRHTVWLMVVPGQADRGFKTLHDATEAYECLLEHWVRLRSEANSVACGGEPAIDQERLAVLLASRRPDRLQAVKVPI